MDRVQDGGGWSDDRMFTHSASPKGTDRIRGFHKFHGLAGGFLVGRQMVLEEVRIEDLALLRQKSSFS